MRVIKPWRYRASIRAGGGSVPAPVRLNYCSK